MKKLVSILSLTLMLFVVSACGNDEPKLSETGTLSLGCRDAATIVERNFRNNNLLTLQTDFPEIKVSSIYSLTAVPPTIAYVGIFDSLTEIPLAASGAFSKVSELRDYGGYIIKLKQTKMGTNETIDITLRLFVTYESQDVDGIPQSIKVDYEIYRP